MDDFFDDDIGGVGTGAIMRSLDALALGTAAALEDRRQGEWEEASDEVDQQFILPLSFKTRDKPVTVKVDISFEVAFLIDSTDRSATTDRPLFTFGFEHRSGERPLLSAFVDTYASNGRYVTGATVSVTAFRPQPYGKRKVHEWAGFLHANFQGYAAPLSDPTDDIEDDDNDG